MIMDEPATARALAGFVARALACGAVDASEVRERTGIDSDALQNLAFPKRASENRRSS